MVFQRLLDFFPHEALLRVLMDRVRIDELLQVLLRRSQTVVLIGLIVNVPVIRIVDHAIATGSDGRCEHDGTVEIVLAAQPVETIVGFLPTEMKDREHASTFDATPTKVVGQVQFQRQTKLRIDRVDVEIRPVVDGEHDVRYARDFDANLIEEDLLLRAEPRREQQMNDFVEMSTSADHVDREHAHDHQRDAKVRVLRAVAAKRCVDILARQLTLSGAKGTDEEQPDEKANEPGNEQRDGDHGRVEDGREVLLS